MFEFKSDLAVEMRSEAMKRYGEAHKGEIDGVKYEEKEVDGIGISIIDILTERGEEELSKKRGRYVTLTLPDVLSIGYTEFTRMCEVCAAQMLDVVRYACGKVERVLLCGLGNAAMTPDALGADSVSNVLVTHHLKEENAALLEKGGFFDIAAVCPDVSAATGLDASDILKGAVRAAKPDVIIAVDALAARECTRLCRTLQICSTGISPGSGVGNRKNAIDKESMGVPVISLGVPTVIDAATLVYDATRGEREAGARYSSFFVCPKEIDELNLHLSKMIGYSINRAFHRGLSFEDMTIL